MSRSKAQKQENVMRLFGDFLEFKLIDHRCSPLTLSAYKQDLHALEQWCSIQALENPTKADMRRFVADMKKKGLADSTVKRRWSAYNQFFDYLIDEEKVEGLTRSPTRGFKHPIIDQEEAFHLEPVES
jgi:site-specific recombinase XerD